MSSAWEDEENKNQLSKKNNPIEKKKHVQRLSIQDIPSIIIKQSSLQIGRYCECGCGYKIPSNSRKDRRFFSAVCRRNYANQVNGYSESKNIVRARLKINKPRMLTLYPGNGDVIKIKITKECKDILDICDKMEKVRQK